MITIAKIYIHPVKSLAGFSTQSAELSKFGLKHDRRWLIIDENNKFITQREFHILATIKTAIKDNQLILSHENDSFKVPQAQSDAKQIEVTVWDDTFKACHVDNNVDSWLSKIIDKPVSLVYMNQDVQRQIDTNFANVSQYVSFADAFPLLFASNASIDSVNSRLDKPVSIKRFRPNIVVDGVEAFGEDNWKDFSINNVDFVGAKPCSRCVMPSINQQTGIKDRSDLLVQLAKFRKVNNKIKFGQNVLYKNANLINAQVICVGDKIKLK